MQTLEFGYFQPLCLMLNWSSSESDRPFLSCLWSSWVSCITQHALLIKHFHKEISFIFNFVYFSTNLSVCAYN